MKKEDPYVLWWCTSTMVAWMMLTGTGLCFSSIYGGHKASLNDFSTKKYVDILNIYSKIQIDE